MFCKFTHNNINALGLETITDNSKHFYCSKFSPYFVIYRLDCNFKRLLGGIILNKQAYEIASRLIFG